MSILLARAKTLFHGLLFKTDIMYTHMYSRTCYMILVACVQFSIPLFSLICTMLLCIPEYCGKKLLETEGEGGE